jgi:hypothetical protein
VITEPHTWQ